MHKLITNVNSAFDFFTTRAYLASKTLPETSGYEVEALLLEDALWVSREHTRNGEALVFGPQVSVTYIRPLQYLLYNAARNVNPFFHFIEAVWMFAGRSSVASLDYFCEQIAEYSDTPTHNTFGTPIPSKLRLFNGAYGYRWRHKFSLGDQLMTICKMLREDPTTRRAVLQIWDCNSDLNSSSKDIPCNMMCTFQVHQGALNLVVHNRSNDMMWGMFGSNVVHFSMLLELIAIASGCKVGLYTQTSDNPHIYKQHWPKLSDYCTDETPNPYTTSTPEANRHIPVIPSGTYGTTDLDCFFCHCQGFIALLIEHTNYRASSDGCIPEFNWPTSGNPFLDCLGVSLVNAYTAHKHRKYASAFQALEPIKGTYWYPICHSWLCRRAQTHINRQAAKADKLKEAEKKKEEALAAEEDKHKRRTHAEDDGPFYNSPEHRLKGDTTS